MEPRNRDDSLADSLILIRQAKGGDEAALNDLFKRYSPRVLQIVRLRLGAAMRAKLESQDIVQEAFARAVKGFDRFELRHEGAFLHWLGELIRNSIRDRADHFGALKRNARLESPLEAGHAPDASVDMSLPGFDPTPSRILENQEDLRKLTDAMDRLPEDVRDVIVYRDLEELSFAEIGEMMGRSEDAARMHYVRAKAKLAGLFEGG